MAPSLWARAKAMATPEFMLVGIWVAFFYFTSASASIMNKQVVNDLGTTPVVLTLSHLLVSVGLDGFILWAFAGQDGVRSDPKLYSGRGWTQIVISYAPIAFFTVMGKLTTYASYEYISVTLTHTTKASEPVFNVLLSALLFGDIKPLGVYLSLVPIAGGVILATASATNIHPFGLGCALLSAMMKVMQNIYTKKVMNTKQFSFFEVHFYCGVASLLVLFPFLLVEMGSTAAAGPAGEVATVLPLADRAMAFISVIVCAYVQFAASVSSYMILSLVPHLTFTITNTMKRVVIIGSDLVVNGGFSWLPAAGVLIAVSGVLGYNLTKGSGSGKSSLKGSDDEALRNGAAGALATPAVAGSDSEGGPSGDEETGLQSGDRTQLEQPRRLPAPHAVTGRGALARLVANADGSPVTPMAEVIEDEISRTQSYG